MAHNQRAGRRPIGWLVLGYTVLIAGCIAPASDYPYTAPDVGHDAGSKLPDAPTCTPASDEDLCMLAGADCGELVAEDRCGDLRVVDCGGCGEGVCTSDLTCCTPDSDEEFCDAYQANCGLLTGHDNCGAQRIDVRCGSCEGVACNGTTCGACEAERDNDFCERLGRECGVLTSADNCGDERTVDCGTCQHGSDCMGSSVCVCPGGLVEANCADGADNDCDGLRDCEDPDCEELRCGTGLDLRICKSAECKLL